MANFKDTAVSSPTTNANDAMVSNEKAIQAKMNRITLVNYIREAPDHEVERVFTATFPTVKWGK